MQQVVDYLRANAAYDPSLLVQQLRGAGHDDQAITQAWDVAFPRTAEWPRQGHYHAGAGTREFAVTLPSTRGGMPTWAIALLVVAGLAALGGVVGLASTIDGIDRSEQVLGDEVAAAVAEETDLSRAEAEAVFDSVGGATIDGALPAGWSELQDGVWGTRATGSNVLVAVIPAPEGMSLDELVTANVDRARTDTSFSYGTPRETTMFDQEARTLETSGTIGRIEFEGEQTYLLVGDDMVIVNATIMSERDRADIDRVVDQLRLT